MLRLRNFSNCGHNPKVDLPLTCSTHRDAMKKHLWHCEANHLRRRTVPVMDGLRIKLTLLETGARSATPTHLPQFVEAPYYLNLCLPIPTSTLAINKCVRTKVISVQCNSRALSVVFLVDFSNGMQGWNSCVGT
jgi:hypothetical protein